MGFTEKKFSELSQTNRYKKTVFVIKEFIYGRKGANSPEEMVSWLNKYEKNNYLLPIDTKGWGLLAETILQKIGDFSEYIESTPYDNPYKTRIHTGISILLDNIRSPHNVGAILRTAEAFGIDEVILSGITPGLENSKTKRTAMNVIIDVRHVVSAASCVESYKKSGYTIVSIEKTRNSLDISGFKLENRTLLVFGNEEFGVSEDILKISDYILHIPLIGAKNSLNVSVAAGIAIFSFTSNMQIKG